MNFYENFIVETRSPIPTAVSGWYKGRVVGEKTKYSNACEHVLRGKGEKKAFKIPTECATLKQLIVVIVPFRGTRKLRVQLARLVPRGR